MRKENVRNTSNDNGANLDSNTRSSYSDRNSNRSRNSRSKNKSKYKTGNRCSGDRSVDTRSISTNGSPVINDPNWYFADKELATQATQVAFNQYLGVPFKLSEEEEATDSIPTIMKIAINPSAGYVNPVVPMNAGINMQAYKLYTRLSSINAKTTNYAPQDLTTFLLAMGNLLSTISHIRRFFGVAFSYNIRNRVYPLVTLDALGVRHTEFLSGLADFRLQFNTLINTINKIPIPTNISYLQKCATMFDNLYLDSETSMAQTYALVPYTCWVFNEAYNEQGSGLTTTSIPGLASPDLFSSYMTVLQSQVNALLQSTTLNYIYSDILNLANKESVPLATIPIVPENYVVVPTYNVEALMQINNARILYAPLKTVDTVFNNTPANDVTPNVNKNAVNYNPAFKLPTNSLLLDQVLNFQTNTPDTAQIIESSRFAAIAGVTNLESEYYVTSDVALADWYCVHAMIYVNDVPTKWDRSDNFIDVDGAVDWGLTLLANMSKFDYSPRFNIMSDGSTFITGYGDLDYFTTINAEYLRRVNDLAMQGLFELR